MKAITLCRTVANVRKSSNHFDVSGKVGMTNDLSPHMPIALSRGNFQVLQRKVGLPRVATPRVGLIYLPEARHACIS